MRISTTDIQAIIPDAPADNKQIDSTITTDKSDIAPPFSAHTEVKGTPYTVQYLGIPDYLETAGQLDVDGLHSKVADLESRILSRIQTNGMDDTVESYNEIVEGISKYLNISKNELPEVKLDKLYTYMKLSDKQNSLQSKLDKVYNQISKVMRHRIY